MLVRSPGAMRRASAASASGSSERTGSARVTVSERASGSSAARIAAGVLARGDREHEVDRAGEALEHGGERARRLRRVRGVDDDQRSPRHDLDAPGQRDAPERRAHDVGQSPRRRGAAEQAPRAGGGERGVVGAGRAEQRQSRGRLERPVPEAHAHALEVGALELAPEIAGRSARRRRRPPRRGASTTASASLGSAPTIAGTPGFRMPAFSAAIAARVSPRRSVCSSSMLVTQVTAGDAGVGGVEATAEPHFEDRAVDAARRGRARRRPRWSRRRRSARASGCPARSASTCGRTASTAAASAAPSTSAPSMRKRSVQRSRCGEVKVPTRRPAPRRIASAISAVVPLPFEPAMCSDRQRALRVPSRGEQRADRVEREAPVRPVGPPLDVDQPAQPGGGVLDTAELLACAPAVTPHSPETRRGGRSRLAWIAASRSDPLTAPCSASTGGTP